jgi:hypothetical protein
MRHDNGTLDAIPQHVLHGPARDALVALAQLGNVYAYHGLGDDPEDFVVYIEALARVRPGHNGKVHLDDWAANYAEYYAACIAGSI